MKKPTEKEQAATIQRVMRINDRLKAKGLTWEEIDQFWAEIFKEHGGGKKPQCPQMPKAR